MPSTISAGTTAGTAIAVAGDTTGNLAFQTNGTTTAMTIDTSQNVGFGTSSPSNRLHVAGSTRISGVSTGSSALIIPTGDILSDVSSGAFAIGNYGDSSSEMRISTRGFTTFRTGATDGTNGTERMRIDSSGNLLVGTTNWTDSSNGILIGNNSNSRILITNSADYGLEIYGATTNRIGFAASNSANRVGSITVNTTNTAYNTSSDYRLKENIAPMVNALGKVAQLKPCTYTWKVDGSEGEGFIAHELAEVMPQAVTGVKDAIETYKDEDGVEQTRPNYQGIDVSFLVATLTSAIQELNAKVDAQALEIQALKGA
jgi:hypothetical protein